MRAMIYRLLIFCFLVLLCGCSDEDASYKVAYDPSWYPQDFRGKEPTINGFSADLLRAAGEERDFSVDLVKAGPEFLEWGLNQGKWDAILTSLSPAINYEEQFVFSDPYLLLGPVIVVPASSSVKGLADLAGKTVGVLRGSLAVTILAEKVPGVVILAYDSPAIALEALLADQYEAVAMPILIAGSYVADLYSDRLKIVTAPLSQEGLRLVATKAHEDLIYEFNKGLEDVRGSAYEALLHEWRLMQP